MDQRNFMEEVNLNNAATSKKWAALPSTDSRTTTGAPGDRDEGLHRLDHLFNGFFLKVQASV